MSIYFCGGTRAICNVDPEEVRISGVTPTIQALRYMECKKTQCSVYDCYLLDS